MIVVIESRSAMAITLASEPRRWISLQVSAISPSGAA